jgi:hypothetical protein
VQLSLGDRVDSWEGPSFNVLKFEAWALDHPILGLPDVSAFVLLLRHLRPQSSSSTTHPTASLLSCNWLLCIVADACKERIQCLWSQVLHLILSTGSWAVVQKHCTTQMSSLPLSFSPVCGTLHVSWIRMPTFIVWKPFIGKYFLLLSIFKADRVNGHHCKVDKQCSNAGFGLYMTISMQTKCHSQ